MGETGEPVIDKRENGIGRGERTINLAGLKLPRNATIASMASTLILMVDYYYNFAERWLPETDFPGHMRYTAYDHFVLYMIVPVLIIVLILRGRPGDYGLKIGDWRTGLKWVAISWVVSGIVLYLAAGMPDVQAYYQRFADGPLGATLTAAIDLVGWEFFFRGFLLFAMYRAIGPAAIVVQMVPFALMHNGKPVLETLSTVFSGVYFGWISWRTGSFVYVFLIHLFIMSFIVFAVA